MCIGFNIHHDSGIIFERKKNICLNFFIQIKFGYLLPYTTSMDVMNTNTHKTQTHTIKMNRRLKLFVDTHISMSLSRSTKFHEQKHFVVFSILLSRSVKVRMKWKYLCISLQHQRTRLVLAWTLRLAVV